MKNTKMNSRILSHAKINLCLCVGARREDGFHDVDTVMARLALGDDIEIQILDREVFEVSVPGFPELETPDNLVLKAARAFFVESALLKGVRIEIQKKIPVGGGLGGGSSNAAAILKSLDQTFPGLSSEALGKIASDLGSDIPFFLLEDPLASMTGRGEKVFETSKGMNLAILLVNPGFAVPTGKVYGGLERILTCPRSDGTPFALRGVSGDPEALEALLEKGNDLAHVAEGLHPQLREIREELRERGAYFSQLSGSGATVFGLFRSMKAAEEASKNWPKEFEVMATSTEEARAI